LDKKQTNCKKQLDKRDREETRARTKEAPLPWFTHYWDALSWNIND